MYCKNVQYSSCLTPALIQSVHRAFPGTFASRALRWTELAPLDNVIACVHNKLSRKTFVLTTTLLTEPALELVSVELGLKRLQCVRLFLQCFRVVLVDDHTAGGPHS